MISPYLAQNIEYFGEIGGFDVIYRHLKSKEHGPSLRLLRSLLFLVTKVCPIVYNNSVQDLFWPFMIHFADLIVPYVNEHTLSCI